MGIIVQGFFVLGGLTQGWFSAGIIPQGRHVIGVIAQGKNVSGIIAAGAKAKGMFAKTVQTWTDGIMFTGDSPRKILSYLFIYLIKGYILTPNLMYTENHRANMLLILLLQLVLFEDYTVWGIILSISCHTTDMGGWNMDSSSDVSIYFLLYCIHYYVVYFTLVRGFFNRFQKSEKENHEFGPNAKNSLEMAWFLKKHQTKFAIFYCLDIPIGSYQFYNNDPGVMLVLKYHIGIKLLISAHMIMVVSK